MLISKFNRMIRSKVLWTIFALLVSISFLGYFSPDGSCSIRKSKRGRTSSPGQVPTQGILFNQDVTRDEFLSARYFEMGLRQEGDLPAKARERIDQRTWHRIAALRMATEMGLTATDAEIRESIQRDPNLTQNGVFDPARYRAIIENRLRVSVETFEDYLRQELTLQKTLDALESIHLTAPTDLRDKLSGLTDRFTVQYTTLQPDLSKTPAVMEKDAEAIYKEHLALFKKPARVSVRYVGFPVSNQLASALTTDSAIKEYYDDHDDEFMSTETNSSSRLPLEQVKDKITGILKEEIAQTATKNIATDFAMTLIPDRKAKAPSFEEAAAASHLTVHTSALFAVTGPITNLEVSADFCRAAFELDPSDPTRAVSDAIVEKDVIYVLSLNEKKPEYTPEFSVVKDRAMALAKKQANDKAFRDQVRQTREKLHQTIASGKTFASAAASLSLPVNTNIPVFTAYEGLTNDVPYSEEIVLGVMPLGKGDISAPIRATNGVLLAYVADRQPGDLTSTELIRPQMLAMLERYSAAPLFNDWQTYLLTAGNFQDLSPKTTEDPEGKTEDETEDDGEESSQANPEVRKIEP